MASIRTGSMQAAGGAYCALIGCMMLVVPHQFAGPAFTLIRRWLPGAGALWLAVGVGLLVAATLAPGRRATRVAHASTTVGLFALTVSAVAGADWFSAVPDAGLCVGMFGACWLNRVQPPCQAERGGANLLAMVAGAVAVALGALTLTAPDRFVAASVGGPIPLTLLGVVGPLVGLAAALARPSVTVAGLRWWMTPLLGIVYLAYLVLVPLPLGDWPGLAYFGTVGSLLVGLPLVSLRSRRIDPTSLWVRLSLSLAAAAMLPVMVVVMVVTERQERASVRATLIAQRAAATSIADDLAEDLSLFLPAVARVAATPGLLERGPVVDAALLAAAERDYGHRIRFALYDGSGALAGRSSDDETFPATFDVASATGLAGSNVIWKASDDDSIEFARAAPVHGDDGSVRGAVVGHTEMAWVENLLARTETADPFQVFILDAAGPVFTGRAPRVGRVVDPAATRGFVPRNRTDAAGTTSVVVGGRPWLAGYAAVAEHDWDVLVVSSESAAVAAIRSGRELAILVILGLGGAVALLGGAIAAHLASPLAALSVAAGRLANGDADAPLPATGVGEIRRLTEQFGAMRDRLAQRTSESQTAQAEVRALNAVLERRVADRTAELENAVGRLESEVAERGRFAAALRASEERYRSVVNHTTEVIFQTDSAGRWTFLNPAWTAITGFPVESALGQPFLDFVHPEDRDRNQRLFLPLIRREKEYCRHEIRYLTRDGGFRWIEVFAQLTFNAAGAIVGTSGTLNDVTDRRLAEDATQAERDFALQVMSVLGQGLTITDADARFEYVNPAYARMVGVDPAELIGRSPIDLTIVDDQAVLDEARERRRRGESSTYETRLKRPDGATVPVLITGVPRWRDGRVEGAIAAVTDLTQQKRAEAVVERERSMLANLMTSMSDGLVVIDADERLRFGNEQAGAILGVDVAALVGGNVGDILTTLQASVAGDSSLRGLWNAAKVDVENRPIVEATLERPTRRDVQAQIFPVPGDGGEHDRPGIGVVLRDVTAERDLARTKDELVAVVSHELRTPLASIVGFAEVLLDRDFPVDQQRRFLGIIREEGARLTGLINDFLDIERMEGGRLSQRLAPTDPVALIAQAVEHFGFDPKTPVLLDGPATLPPVNADHDRILQVLGNLLSNARKYSPNGGAIRLGARLVGDAVEISIADRGLGLPPEAISRLFEKFYRVDNTDRRSIKGTGLGLAICKQIVAGHGGRIWVESAGLGRGSTFRFTLPLAHLDTDGVGVLVVEDDAGFAQLVGTELGRFNISMEHANSVEAALAQIARARPRALVLDLVFPRFSGDDILVHLAGTPEGTLPTVVVTARDVTRDEIRRLRRLGAVAVLQKGPRVAADAAEIVARILSDEWDPDAFEEDRWLRRDADAFAAVGRAADTATGTPAARRAP